MDTIYLDHNATTPMRPEVIEAVAACWRAGHANPASQHQPGQKARRLLERAREQIAAILGADLSGPKADRLIFTSGGTEANNLAVLGIAREPEASSPPGRCLCDGTPQRAGARDAPDGRGVAHGRPGRHVGRRGTRGGVGPALDPPDALASVMLGNHETGVLQPVAELAAACNGRGVPLHTDAVQVAGKLAVDFRGLGVAAMSVAAHKFQGPLGIGALLVRHDVAIQALELADIDRAASDRARNPWPWQSAWPRHWNSGIAIARPSPGVCRPSGTALKWGCGRAIPNWWSTAGLPCGFRRPAT